MPNIWNNLNRPLINSFQTPYFEQFDPYFRNPFH